MMAAKAASVKALTGGIEMLFKANKVRPVNGIATIKTKNEVYCHYPQNQLNIDIINYDKKFQVSVKLASGGEENIITRNILIASGSEVTPFPALSIDEEQV